MRAARSFAPVGRSLLALVAVVAVVVSIGATAAAPASSGLTNPKHYFWAPGQDPQGTVASLTNDIIWHGGNAGPGAIGIEKAPAVYLIWWGPQWASGFTTPDTDGKLYSSKTLQKYLADFFANVGGSAWAAVQTQYCRGILAGATSCTGQPNADFITNPRGQLKGVWTDPTPVPADIVTLGLAENLVNDPIAMEAQRAAGHFGFNPDATYIVLTPPGTVGTGQPVYCGYHTQTTSIDGYGNPLRIQYSFIPFLNTDWPGLGNTGCGMHNVNATSNAYGNGVFDGYSIVVGHEYSEAVTDPDNFFSDQDGWNDAQGSENADKCAWTNTHNITLAGHSYAVQPTWSNEAFDSGKDPCGV
jgi:serine protease